MSTHLDPLIQQKLRAFARRRRRLIVTRGLFAALAMLLLTMLIVAAIDYQFVLPDWGRWALSGTAYTAVLIIAWRQCLTWLLHAPDERQLARLIEHAEPKLREDLLSAVELGEAKNAVFDSEQFRGLVQQDVSHRMENVEVKSLLPVALIRRYIGYAFCIAAMVVAMGMATGWQFSTLLLRALMPGANLDRVSRTKVLIHKPVRGDDLVAQGDTVRVEIELHGERAGKAFIETFGEKDGWQVTEMQPLGKDQFAATINVGRENVRYRIKAGDALTRKYLLDARERPFITQFEKTYHFPGYAKLPPRTVTEPDGTLIALEGSEVELKLKPNQPVKSAELRLEQGRNSSVIALTPAPNGQLVARVPLNASGSYRVHLVGAETGFENKFSPENELRAEPDLMPSVELLEPKNDLILPNNELVDLLGAASDDLGLAKVAQWVKVNDGGWKETVLMKDGLQQKARVEHRWDLYELSAKPGDLLTTKLVATDLKGNKGESRPLQITVTAAGFELRRLQALESLRALNATTHALAQNAGQLGRVAQKSREAFTGDNADAQRQAVVAWSGALAEFETKFIEAWTTLGAALREAPAGHVSAELVMLGRELARLDTGTARAARVNLDLLAANPSPGGARELAVEAGDLCAKAQHRATLAETAMEAFVTAEEAAALAENGQVVAREQQRLMELAAASGNDAKKWQPLVTRLRVALTQTKALEDLLAPIAERNGSKMKDRARQTITKLGKRRARLEQALAAGEFNSKRLYEPALEMTRTLADHARQFGDWHRDLGYQPVKMVQEILQDVGPAYTNVSKLSSEIAAIRKNDQFALPTQVALLDSRWTLRGEALKAHGDLEEIRTAADNQFVGDLRMATAALQALHAVSPGTEQAKMDERLATMDRSLRILESGHNLQEALDGLNHLATNERWDLRSLSVRTQSPRDWRWLEGRLRAMPEEMGEAKESFDQAGEKEIELRKAFDGAMQILWKAQQLGAWQGVEQEMQQRPNQDRGPVSAKADAEMLAGQVKLALDLLRKHMDDARKRLAEVSPGISELAAALAKEQEEIKKETQEQAQQAEKQKPEEAKAENAQQLVEQQKLNEKVETLKDLIRAEANKQNILEQEQRELMRDADDALALLKDPPPKAEQALQDATNDAPAQQKADLERATEQQQKLQDALTQIAKHFEAAEQGKSLAETRAALREAEKELGIQEQLDQQFARAQELAEMAQKDPAALLAELEAKLPQNPIMAKELSEIAQDALANAEKKLEQATNTEKKVAEQVAQQAKEQANPQPKNAAQTAAEAAKQAMEAAKAAAQLAEKSEKIGEAIGNKEVDQLADRAQDRADDAAKAAEQAMQAAQKMAKTQNAGETAKAAEEVMQKAGEAAQAAQESAQAAKEAQAEAQGDAQKGGDQQAKNQESAQKAGEAAQQAEKAAMAAKQAQQLAQQAKAMAENPQLAQANAQNPQQAAQTAAQSAEQAAQKAAMAAKAAQKAAESAEAQATAAENPAAAQQADAAGNEAAQAAAEAQAAADAAKMAAKSGKPQEAMQAAQQAAQKAGQAAQAAEKAANAAQQAEQSSQKAAQKGGENQGKNQQAAQQSGEAKAQAMAAAQAAKQAQAMAQQAAQQAMSAAQQNQQLAQAAQQQQGIAQNANEAGADVERAGRHEMRLGNQAGQQIQQLGEQIGETGQNDVPAAQQALNKAQMAAQAQGAVQQAAGELAQELAALQNAAQGNPQQPNAQSPQGQPAGQPQGQQPQSGHPPQAGQPPQGAPQSGAPPSGQPQGQPGQPQGGQPQPGSQPGEGAPASPAEQQAMARALDALDQQLNGQPAGAQAAQQGQPAQGQPGESSGQPGQPSAAQSALAQAAQAAQAAMRQGRAQQGMAQQPNSLMSQSQSPKSEGGALAQGTAIDYQLATDATALKRGEWGKLPKKLADQLTKGQQEAIAGDYRQAVETYYKVIAEKAKQQK